MRRARDSSQRPADPRPGPSPLEHPTDPAAQRNSAALTRLARAPDVLIACLGREFLVKDLRGGRRIAADLKSLAILSLFDRPRSEESVVRSLESLGRRAVRTTIRQLRRIGLLLTEDEWKRRSSFLAAWNQNLASAQYHVATRDARYVRGAKRVDDLLQERVDSVRRPAKYKRYARLPRVSLPRERLTSKPPEELEGALLRRRTVRRFSGANVSLRDLAAIVRLTWGQTGWLGGGPVGKLLAKTSPSGGGLHPIECYVAAWNVRGLPAGLYHYDVASDAFHRLRPGDFRRAAVRSASGQSWIGKAAFLCVMTAVFERTLWKYQYESAYRVVWLDAGHLAQTFCLVATSRGLGSFTTAAIQDSYIEQLIGIDGVKEFPVYLCGAGVPAKKLL